jgi:hypothetical protein
MKSIKLLIAALAGACSLPLAAQPVPATVSAANPEGMMQVLLFAGYSAELDTDNYGDPLIDTEFAGWPGSIVFFGCDEDTRTGCDSVQLRAGFDRAEPMPLDLLNDALANGRYFAVHLDEEGDPWVHWDIVTGSGEGIPASVFMRSVNSFGLQIETVADIVFAEEREKKADVDSGEDRTAETT